MTENKIELTYINNQDDYFEHQLFEKYWDCWDNKNRLNRQITIQMAIAAALLAVIFLVPYIDNSYAYLVLAFAFIFLFRFVYEKKWGYISDYKNMNALYQDLKKKRIVNVYDEKIKLEITEEEISLISDTNRRFCGWEDFDYIQETDNLIIMHVKLSNKQNLIDFEPIKIAKRYIFPEKVEALRQLINKKREEHKIGVLTDDPTNPYIGKVE